MLESVDPERQGPQWSKTQPQTGTAMLGDIFKPARLQGIGAASMDVNALQQPSPGLPIQNVARQSGPNNINFAQLEQQRAFAQAINMQ